MDKKIKKIIKENIWGYTCKECQGGGANGQDKCNSCNGTGIINWELDLGTEQLKALFKSEMLSIIGEDEIEILGTGIGDLKIQEAVSRNLLRKSQRSTLEERV